MVMVGRAAEGDSMWYTRPATGERFVSVTTALGAALNKPWLPGWAAGVTATFVIANWSQIGQMMRDQGPVATKAWIKDEATRIRQLKADIGVHQHNVLEALLMDVPIPDLPEHLHDAVVDGEHVDHDAISDGLVNFLSDHQPDVDHSETTVASPNRGYAGTLDTGCRFPRGIANSSGWLIRPGEDACGDLKSGKHLSETVGAQLEAYRRAPDIWVDEEGTEVDHPLRQHRFVLHLRRREHRHTGGYRVRVLPNGDAAETDWRHFLKCLDMLRTEFAHPEHAPIGYPPTGTGDLPPALVADMDLRRPVIDSLIAAGLHLVGDLAVMTGDELQTLRQVGPKAVQAIRSELAHHGLALADDTPGGEK